jgi:hypothetical protein
MRIALLIAVTIALLSTGCQKEIKEIRNNNAQPALAMR